MRIYISGPITGCDNFKERFTEAEEMLANRGYEVVNPARVDIPCLTYEEYMKIDFTLLDMCDAVYMLSGWKKSLGANREYGYAIGKNMPILDQEKGEVVL